MPTIFPAYAVAPVVVEPFGRSLELGQSAILGEAALQPVAAVIPAVPIRLVVVLGLHRVLRETGTTSEPQAGHL
jgi:phosphotransferase system  glucose/maltose/N-acetylglucosamine-specific IIC component